MKGILSSKSQAHVFASVRTFTWKLYLCFCDAVCSKLDDCKISLSDGLFDIVITDSYDTTMTIVPSTRFIRHIRMITCSKDYHCAWLEKHARVTRVKLSKTGNPKILATGKCYCVVFFLKCTVSSCFENAKKIVL